MHFIQIIGTQRSGSNLLRAMLNQLPEIAAPHPPHILETFEPLLPLYGELDHSAAFDALVQDVCLWVELNPVPWQNEKLDRDKIKDRCRRKSLVELFYQVYAYYAETQKSTYACCKSMVNVHRYKDLEQAGLQPYYIWLHRDGRDVACSFKKTLVGEKHVYHIARQWKADQVKALEVDQKIPARRFIKVRYRDLITDPEAVLKSICAFLMVAFDRNMLNYFQAEESIKTARSGIMWQNLSQPIITGNYDKYLKELTPEEISIFEKAAGDMLEKLGYSVATDYRNTPQIRPEDIVLYDRQNSRMKEEAVVKADPQDLAARYPQKRMLEHLDGLLSARNDCGY